MKTSVIGYPRIGSLRELKFAEEAYFRNEISETELRQTAGTLRRAHWQSQKDALIDYIPCNDFSFYDTVLDTAVLFNVIPARYKALGLSVLDTYFSMARGYQGSNGDVRALAMKNGLILIITISFPKSMMIQQYSLQAQNLLMTILKHAKLELMPKS